VSNSRGIGEANLVVVFPELSRLGVRFAQLGARCTVVDRVVMIEHAAEHTRRVGAVVDRVQLMGVPDKVKVIAWHQERVWRHAL